MARKAPTVDALFGGLGTVAVTDEGVQQLRIDQVRPGANFRQHFDEEGLAELADSIREHGVVQPILVTPSEDGGYTIVAGERRWRASQMVGLETVPAIVRELSPMQAAEINLIENLQRQDISAIEEALGFQAIIEQCRYTQEELGKRLGKSQSYVANRLRLLKLPAEVQGHISRGILSPGHAMHLLKLEASPEYMIRVAHHAIEKKIPVAQMGEAVERFVLDNAHPLTQDHWRDRPRFDVDSCDECLLWVRVKSSYNGKKLPFCLNDECWEAKQSAVKESLIEVVQKLQDQGQPAVHYGELSNGVREERLGSARFDTDDCRNCESRRVVVYESYMKELQSYEACLNGECFKRKQEEFDRVTAEREQEALRQELDQVRQLATARAARGIDRDLLLWVLGLVFSAVEPEWSRRRAFQDGFEGVSVETFLTSRLQLKVGEDWELGQGDDLLVSVRCLLADLPEEQLLQLLYEWPGIALGLDDVGVRLLYGLEVPARSLCMQCGALVTEVCTCCGTCKDCCDAGGRGAEAQLGGLSTG